MSSSPSIRIAIADDHAMFRKAIIEYIHSYQKEIKVDIEANNGDELITKMKKAARQPEIIVTDINMPVMNGYMTMKQVKSDYPEIKGLAVSMHDSDFAIISMLRAGASGFVAKTENPDVIIGAILDIHTKGYYHSDITERCQYREQLVPKLKEKEIDFLRHCYSDMNYHEIAEKMNISARTAEGYREELFRKLNIKSRSGLVVFAIEAGIIDNCVAADVIA